MPPAAAPAAPVAKTEAELTAAAVAAADALVAETAEEEAEPAAPSAETEAEPAEAAAPKQAASADMQDLREQLAEIRGMLTNRATFTDQPKGAAAPEGESAAQKATRLDKIGKAIKSAETRLNASKAESGETAEGAAGLELIEALGELKEELADLRKGQDGMEKERAETRAQIEQQAITAVHEAITDAAMGNIELEAMLGGSAPSRHTKAQQETRVKVYAVAMRMHANAAEDHKLGVGEPISEEEAIHAAIEKVTGKKLAEPGRSAADQQARNRSRLVKPESGGSGLRPAAKMTPEEAQKAAVAAAEAFAAGR